MFVAVAACRSMNASGNVMQSLKSPLISQTLDQHQRFSVFSPMISLNTSLPLLSKPAFVPQIARSFPLQDQSRSVTKFSLRSGKRKSVKAVIKRFYRLNWGIWIRTKTARHKKMWKKTAKRRARLRQHVFVNGQQSWFLDKCVTKFWRRPKYYVDDIYEPYHERPEFFVTKKPKVF